MEYWKALLLLGLLSALGECEAVCGLGLQSESGVCVDVDECGDRPCGNNTNCKNTWGSFYCQCEKGYREKSGLVNFTLDGQCQDINECIDGGNICGPNASCSNTLGSYKCLCHFGYTEATDHSGHFTDIDECKEASDKQEDLCGADGNCTNSDGSYRCMCSKGFTNYGNERTTCSNVNVAALGNSCGDSSDNLQCICGVSWELDCDNFNENGSSSPSLGGLAGILSMIRSSCLALSDPSVAGEGKSDGEVLLKTIFSATEAVLSPGHLDSRDVSGLLGAMENAIMLIGPQLKDGRTKTETTEMDAEIAVQRGQTPPTGPIHLTNDNATLDTDWTTAAGTGSYPGFALAALLSYKNLEISDNRSFSELTGLEKDGVSPSFQVTSTIVSVVVSNPSTQNLSRSVNITLRHLQNITGDVSYICAYWNESGAWSTDGCYQRTSNKTHTECTCSHLSSFAVLVALYDMKHTFGLQLVTKIGLTISLLCLGLCILTFKFCRSIQGTRTTIHLHLCICLFVADLIFLAGISQTKPVGACRFVAAMLHYFFLGVFTWMLLEGVQLYRMVVLVFNATMRPLYLILTGYGTPLIIVIISAIIRPNGYGTDQHCWLSLEDGLIWSFYGPMCFIVILNVFFFIVTVWKLAQKFTSLNPDLTKLHKIKAFTVTAIAQMCILGLMWVFGAFLFQEGTIVAAYIFTILNSLQGALVFIMHCLLSKQVREEYAHFLSCICTSEKKRYSDLTSTNPSNSQSQASRSGEHTGESQI